MATHIYPSPAWLEESAITYRSTPKFENALKKITTRIYMRIKSEPSWGIAGDMIFGAEVENGVLLELGFVPETEAKAKAEFILTATPQEWKRILTKDSKFVTDFMLGKIQLEQGNKVTLLKIVPRADTFVESLTQVDLKFPDDLTAEELEVFCDELARIRLEKGI